uniref:SFRICE_018012 n=1 Tax=Spodoptera frugiperda TaxID=7108 RepID=A0A2H1VX56_SPOFR
MAAAMSVKNLFSSPFRERLNAYNSKLTWADGSTSDCIAFLNVYKVWSHLRQQQYFRSAGQSEAAWARRFYVQARALRELDELAKDLRKRLATLGIDPHNGKSPWNKHELSLLYKVIIAGAFYPQYFIQVSEDEGRERDAVRTLGGHDPRNTVYLKNFPDDQPGEVYAGAIKKAVLKQISEEPRVTFDGTSKKVYLTFNDGSDVKTGKQNSGDPTIPGQVVLPVYKAVKARQLRIDVRIPLLPRDKAQTVAASIALDKMTLDLERMVPRLPEVDDTHFPLKISQSSSGKDVGKGQIRVRGLLKQPLVVCTSATRVTPSVPGNSLLTRPIRQLSGGTLSSWRRTKSPTFSDADFNFCYRFLDHSGSGFHLRITIQPAEDNARIAPINDTIDFTSQRTANRAAQSSRRGIVVGFNGATLDLAHRFQNIGANRFIPAIFIEP